ncbi:hypothetical protein PO909_010346 [Leuciscus waleckii]
MSLFNATSNFTRNDASALRLLRKSESSDDDEKRLKRREKNRVAAQRSRKKQTQRADELHEEYECLEQENSMLRKEPLCPVLNCGMTSTTRSTGTVPPEFMSR